MRTALKLLPMRTVRVLITLALTLGLANVVSADVITLDTSFPGRGWFMSDGLHLATNDNTFTTTGEASFYTWALTSLAGMTVTEVRLRIGQDGINTQPPLIDINDVTTSEADLIADYGSGSATGQAIYADLTTGNVYGSFATAGPTVPFNTFESAPAIYSLLLNSQAVADLNAAISGGQAYFAVGLEAVSPGAARFDQNPRIQQLIVTATPVPEPATLVLLGSGALSLIATRRKHRRS